MSETARQDLLAFHLNFGFRCSFDIRHSDFVIIQSEGKGSRGDARFEPVLGSQQWVSLKASMRETVRLESRVILR